VFYEEPIEQNDLLKDVNEMMPRKDLNYRKRVEKRKILELMRETNDSEQLYLISSLWVRMWVDFIRQPEGTLPGEIINDMLYSAVD